MQYEVTVTKSFLVTIDPTRADKEFMAEFSRSMFPVGDDLSLIAAHVAYNYDMGATKFVEGVGSLEEMGVEVREVCTETDVVGARFIEAGRS